MIFIALGTQKFQFNRLLKKIDELIEQGILEEEVFAQIGFSSYNPKNFKYNTFLNPDEYEQCLKDASIIISHGGVGTLLTAMSHKKKIIACPRQASFKEHVDDHQFDICNKYASLGYLLCCDNIDELGTAIASLKGYTFKEFIASSNNSLVNYIDEFLNQK